MSDRTILALIIPIFQEQENIPKLIKKINSHIKIPIKIYFIFDSDEDPTIPVIEKLKDDCKFEIFLKKNNYNKGVLNAIKK